MGSSGTFLARHDPDRLARSAVFKARVDTDALTSTALLSYPAPDLAGDIVIPEGMDFAPHARDPRVDLEHRRDPEFGDATVGWARTTCKAPGGYYTVRPVDLECHDGVTRPLPVATTHFDPSDKLQVQAFALVERDILPAVSVEFLPDWTVAKSLGKSALEPRDAYEFPRVRVVRYTLCAKGVCPSALVAKSAYDPLRSVLSANRIGGEQLHPVIYKALAPLYLPGRSNAVVSGYSVEKAMDETVMPESPESAPVETPDDAPALGGIAALYAKAQALLDACDQNESDMETSDSPELRKFAAKMRDKIAAIAEEIKGMADKHDAKLNGGESEESESEEPEEDDEPDMETDEEGTLKAVRAPYIPILKACRVKRYSLAEIRKAEESKKAAPKAADGDSPEDVAFLEKQLRLYERDKRRYG